MRDDVVGDVAAERQLNVIKGLLAVLPRNRGFRIGADLSISVYPASPRARLLAAKQGGSPRLSKRESCSEQGGKRAATNARTHARRSTPSGVRRRRSACRSWPARWPRCCAGNRARRCGPLSCGTARSPPPAQPSPLPPLRPPRRLRRRRPRAPTCACTLPQRKSACTRRTPAPPRRLPPPQAHPRRKGASRGPSPQPSPPPPRRRPTPPPPKPPPTDAQPHRAAPPCRPFRPPRRRPPPGLPYPRVPAIGRKQTSLPGDASAGHPRASTLSPIGQAGGIWPGSRLPVSQSRLS